MKRYLIAWWFMYLTLAYKHGHEIDKPFIVGPFETAASCESIREKFSGRFTKNPLLVVVYPCEPER